MPPPPADWTPHIGRKVTMRYRLDEPGGPHTELLGVLQAVDSSQGDRILLKIMDKRGRTHLVAASEVVAAKVF